MLYGSTVTVVVGDPSWRFGPACAICDHGAVSDQPEPEGPPPSHGGLKKARPTDMVWSLLIIAIPLVIITFLFTRGETPVKEVDWQAPLVQARSEVDWPVLAPEGLPDSWVPIRVSWTPEGSPGLNSQPSPRNQWRLGFLDPSQIYIELNQGDAEIDEFIAETTREGLPDGISQIGEDTWDRLVTADERTRALVLRTPEVTTVVVGDTDYSELETYVTVLED